MILFKAQKVDSEEYVEGYYSKMLDGRHIMYALGKDELLGAICYAWFEEIDQSTLQISLDSGKTWNSVESVALLIELAMNTPSITKEYPKDK